MNTPALGLGWHLWHRHRLGLGILAAYLLSLTLAVHLLPARSFPSQSAFMCALPFGFGILYLLGIFTHPDADVAATGSGYPTYLLTLPVRTRTLVLWPMLYGIATLALAWVALAAWVLLPRGAHLDVWWPAAMLAAVLAALQALFWSPVSLPYLRLALALTLVPALLVIGIGGSQNGVAPSLLTGFFLATLPVSYFLALDGVARARRGDFRDRLWLPEPAGPEQPVGEKAGIPRSTAKKTPFRSPMQAQFWLEWTRNGTMLALLVAAACLLLSLPLLQVRDLTPFRGGELTALGLGRLEVNAWVKTYLPVLIVLPLLLGTVLGGGLRKSDTRKRDRTLHLFLATRPLSDLDMVRIKFKTAFWSALCAWGVTLLFLFLWLLLPARQEETTGPLLLLMLRQVDLTTLLMTFLVLIVLICWTWRNQAVGLFAELAGRTWVSHGYTSAVYGLPLVAFLWLIGWTGAPRDHDLRYEPVPRIVSVVVWSLIALKVVGGIGACVCLLREHLIRPRTLGLLTAAWFLTAGLLFGLFLWLRPGLAVLLGLVMGVGNDGQQFLEGLLSPRTLFLGLVLVFPFTRLALAPLALAWNRHR